MIGETCPTLLTTHPQRVEYVWSEARQEEVRACEEVLEKK